VTQELWLPTQFVTQASRARGLSLTLRQRASAASRGCERPGGRQTRSIEAPPWGVPKRIRLLHLVWLRTRPQQRHYLRILHVPAKQRVRKGRRLRDGIDMRDGSESGWLLLLLFAHGVWSGLLRDFLPG
jgi:hypothetical protein